MSKPTIPWFRVLRLFVRTRDGPDRWAVLSARLALLRASELNRTTG